MLLGFLALSTLIIIFGLYYLVSFFNQKDEAGMNKTENQNSIRPEQPLFYDYDVDFLGSDDNFRDKYIVTRISKNSKGDLLRKQDYYVEAMYLTDAKINKYSRIIVVNKETGENVPRILSFAIKDILNTHLNKKYLDEQFKEF